jgi:hypothetical protein
MLTVFLNPYLKHCPMKRPVITLLGALMFVIASSFTTQDGDPTVTKGSSAIKVEECGPTFIAYNDKNLPVKSIELRNFYTGFSTTVYDPIFPYDFGEREIGVYVFIVTFDAPQEGSIYIKPDVGASSCSGPEWESTWTMSWPMHTCTPNRIKILPDISCRE